MSKDKNNRRVTPKWYSWNRYNEQILNDVEEEIFKDLKVDYKSEYLDLGANIADPDIIYTISLNTDSKNIPLVLIHGMGGGVGIWCCNLKELSRNRPVYAFDLIGFGRSSRPDFSIDGSYVEHQFVKMIEKWREAMKLERFIMLGHSLGGFLSTSYAIKYPERVVHLILTDPWGFTPSPRKIQYPSTLHVYVSYALSYLNPIAPIRLVGPFGEWLVKAARPELIESFRKAFPKGNLMLQYLYHVNAQYPSGERGFWYMSSGFPWCKYPMIKRIHDLDNRIPITHMIGSHSTVDEGLGKLLQEKRKGSYFKTYTVEGAAHHSYIDSVEKFNAYVLEACAYADSQTEY